MNKRVKVRFFLAFVEYFSIFARFLWRIIHVIDFYGETMYAQK